MPIIRTGKTGTGLNSSQTGVMQGATGGGGGGILLPDLVAGWALTAGPQQTLSSAGVVASGPLDLTAAGTPTYGANGAVFNGSDQYLYHSDDAALQTGDIDFTFAAEVIYDSLAALPGSGYTILTKVIKDLGEITGNEYILAIYSGGHGFGTDSGGFFQFVDDSIFAPEGYSLGLRYIVLGWYSAATNKAVIQANNATPVESPTSEAQVIPPGTDLFSIGGAEYGEYFPGKIRHVRFWKRLLNSDERTWLYNAGSGRTDQEVADYAG